jgi:hypothetical protein
VTDADPGRVAGTINGHARSTYTDIGLSNRHADTSSANRYANATHEHANTTYADNRSPNGYASASTHRTDATTAAHDHANLPGDCGHY